MGTHLNNKSEDTCRLASTLAALAGESQTGAVTNAPRSELSGHMTEPVRSDPCDLYDEDGFPR